MALVTGGSRGIGLEIAKRAAADGANIIIAAKTAEPHPKLPGTIYTAAEDIEAAGGTVITATPASQGPGRHVQLPPPLHPLLDPITAIAAFYPMAAALAQARGHDPDNPRGLKKVTSTV